MAITIDKNLLEKIEALNLSENNIAWRKAMRASGWKINADREKWNSMSIRNIARSGIFAADRAVAEYADNIWHVPHK